MASSAASSIVVVPHQQSTAGLTLDDLTLEASSLIAEAEHFILNGHGALLSAGWADEIRSLISEAEARVRGEQVLEGEYEETRDSWDSTETWCRRREQVSYSDTEENGKGAALDGERRKSADSAILAELGNHHASVERKFVLSEPNPKLVAIQEHIYALASVISMQMAQLRSLKQRQTSELALFSILEEEYEILMDVNDQIEDLYQPSNGMDEGLGNGLLQIRFDALPIQLQAVFNMECQERERRGGEISDEEMMALVMETQKRTEILRDIQSVIERKLEASNEMRSN